MYFCYLDDVLRQEVAHVPGARTVVDARSVEDVVVLVVEHCRHNHIGCAKLMEPSGHLGGRQVISAAVQVQVRGVITARAAFGPDFSDRSALAKAPCCWAPATVHSVVYGRHNVHHLFPFSGAPAAELVAPGERRDEPCASP